MIKHSFHYWESKKILLSKTVPTGDYYSQWTKPVSEGHILYIFSKVSQRSLKIQNWYIGKQLYAHILIPKLYNVDYYTGKWRYVAASTPE